MVFHSGGFKARDSNLGNLENAKDYMENSVVPWTSISYFVGSISAMVSELKAYRSLKWVKKEDVSAHGNLGLNQKWESN